jgi:hypothetical protein
MTTVLVVTDVASGKYIDQGYHAIPEDVRDELVHVMKTKAPGVMHDLSCAAEHVHVALPDLSPEMFESVSNRIFKELGEKFLLTHSWRII